MFNPGAVIEHQLIRPTCGTMEVEVTLAKTEKYLFAITPCRQNGQIPIFHLGKIGVYNANDS
jgi:hypothetical protein